VNLRVSAILLAGGASSRMGRAKALLEYRGETFLDRQIALYASIGARVICVLGHDAGLIAGSLRRVREALLVLNPQPEQGQLSSLQCGLRALCQDTEAFFFTPVDSPGVRRETLAMLLDSFEKDAADFWQPSVRGVRGHPVLAPARMAAALLALPPEASARDLIRRSRRCILETADEGAVLDIDTPEDYRRLLSGGLP
jgi:CTP:molybdopterin cytidylyltransferase MocA